MITLNILLYRMSKVCTSPYLNYDQFMGFLQSGVSRCCHFEESMDVATLGSRVQLTGENATMFDDRVFFPPMTKVES